jgi:hypothetical protein
VRAVVLLCLIAGGFAIAAPEQGVGLMRSIIHGFGWGLGREITHNVFGHRGW